MALQLLIGSVGPRSNRGTQDDPGNGCANKDERKCKNLAQQVFLPGVRISSEFTCTEKAALRSLNEWDLGRDLAGQRVRSDTGVSVDTHRRKGARKMTS